MIHLFTRQSKYTSVCPLAVRYNQSWTRIDNAEIFPQTLECAQKSLSRQTLVFLAAAEVSSRCQAIINKWVDNISVKKK